MRTRKDAVCSPADHITAASFLVAGSLLLGPFCLLVIVVRSARDCFTGSLRGAAEVIG